jgi:hypothetical protein
MLRVFTALHQLVTSVGLARFLSRSAWDDDQVEKPLYGDREDGTTVTPP